MNQRGKRSATIALVLLAALSACSKPPVPPLNDPKTVASNPAAEKPVSDSDLASSVVAILRAAHRSGSLIYRAECGPQRSFTEIYPLNPPVAAEPMEQALAEISRRYPGLQWKESPARRIAISDRSMHAGLLKVRIPEFAIIDDRDPEDAVTNIWKIPEVKSYLRRNRLQLVAPPKRAGTDRRRNGLAVVHFKNVTVAQALDAILSSYKDDVPRTWVYRECRGPGQALAEVRVW